MGERSIEVKVGALILVSLGLLVVFILILGRVTTTEGFNLNVMFVHPGPLQPGAPVKIAGSEVGYVDSMTYLGRGGPFMPRVEGERPDAPQKRARVKVKVWIEESVRESILQDAEYYVTQQGLLGEQYLEISPGSTGSAVRPEANVFGIDPPRLDQALANGATSLATINNLLSRNEDELDELIRSTTNAMKTVDKILSNHEGELDDVVTHADEALVEGRDALRDARKMYIDNPRINRVLTNLDGTTTLLAAHDDELISDVDHTVDNVNELIDTVGPEQREQIRNSLDDLEEVMDSATTTMDDVESVVGRVRRGEGTVGALLIDEEVYDDLKELLRDLKHNPWKFFWRE
jgi:phospholipid/cholesterol/gamma-HCH transport system substrate-binding protein